VRGRQKTLREGGREGYPNQVSAGSKVGIVRSPPKIMLIIIIIVIIMIIIMIMIMIIVMIIVIIIITRFQSED
jgi:hypothetical protein